MTRPHNAPDWTTAASIWPPTATTSWTDYTIEAFVRRSAIRQTGSAPVVGAGMDRPGSRRLELITRAQDAENAYVHTFDPESGDLVVTVVRRGQAERISRSTWSPNTRPAVTLRVQVRGRVLTAYVDDVLIDQCEDSTWDSGAAGLGCPNGARATVTAVSVTATDGRPLAGEGTAWPWPTSSALGEDGALALAERSRGLLPPVGEWAFLRTEFALDAMQDGDEATLCLAAASPEPARQFVARASLNGHEVSTFPMRAIAGENRYDRLNVSELLQPGTNALGLLAWAPRDQRVQVELKILRSNGTVRRVVSDATWRAAPGDQAYAPSGSIGTGYYAAPAEHLQGHAYPWGFDRPGFDDSSWQYAVEKPALTDLQVNPVPPVRIEQTPPQHVSTPASDAVVLDFGWTRVGGISLSALGHEADLTVRFGELLDENGRVRSRMPTGNHYEDRWKLTGGEPEARTWGLRVFRYVEIEGLSVQEAAAVHAVGHVYPLGELTRFRCDNRRLCTVLDLCTATMVQNNGPLLVDSWSREREPYEADAYLQAKADAALSADTDLSEYALDYLLRRRTWPTEWPFYLVILAWEQYLRSGDLAALARRRDALAELLPVQWIDPGTGLIRKEHGADGTGSKVDHDIVDWPPTERDGYRFGPVNTVVNAVAYAAFSAMSRIDTALGLQSSSAHERCARGIAEGVRDRLWDEALGTCIDGLDAQGRPLPHAAAHAGAFASALGVLDDDRAARVAGHLASRGMPVSVYAAPFLLQALIRGGRADAAFELITAEGDRSWLGMLEQGAGATMEAWNERVKPNVSCAHPWGASPLFITVEGLLGIRPLEPEFRMFEVVPHLPAAVHHLGADLPTARGPITVDLERVSSSAAHPGIRAHLQVPEGSRCRFRLDDVDRVLPAGEHSILVPKT